MPSNSKNTFLLAVEYIPLLSALIIVLGCVRIVVYYAVFKLNILDYAELTDFLSNGIVDIIIIALFFSFSKGTTIHSKNLIHKSYNAFDLNSRWSLYKLTDYMAIMILVIVIIRNTIQFFRTREISEFEIYFALGYLGTALLLYLSNGINKLYKILYKENADTDISLFTHLTGIYISILCFYTYNNALKVKYNQLTYKDSITIEKQVIISNEKYYYIGQTKTYLFYHNAIDNTNDIYQKSQISKITLH